MTLEAHEDYAGCYWVVWPDGVKSVNFYNFPRAKQHIRDIQRQIESTMPPRSICSPVGAFK